MLGNEKLLFDELYEKTKDCGRVQFVKLLMTKERENKKLKKINNRLYNENCKLREEHNITDISLLDENYKLQQKYVNAVADYETTMAEKNELEKQLEECKDKINWYENFEVNKTIDQLRLKHNIQQKEFIKYLEDEINKEKDDLEKLCELYNIPKENDIAYKFFYSYINKLEKILKKYKEIIGVSDENNTKKRN